MSLHNSLTGSDLHEPKGVASANLDEMYHANGAGSGVWKKNPSSTHGEMLVTGFTTPFLVPIAADSTLATDSDYGKITQTGMWQAGHLAGTTFNVDELVIGKAGDYEITFWSSIEVTINNALVGIKYAINDLPPYSTRKILTRTRNSNDVMNIGGIGIVGGLSVGDTVSLYIAADTAVSVIGREAGLSIKLLS